jgi:hypothetical protein
MNADNLKEKVGRAIFRGLGVPPEPFSHLRSSAFICG